MTRRGGRRGWAGTRRGAKEKGTVYKGQARRIRAWRTRTMGAVDKGTEWQVRVQRKSTGAADKCGYSRQVWARHGSLERERAVEGNDGRGTKMRCAAGAGVMTRVFVQTPQYLNKIKLR